MQRANYVQLSESHPLDQTRCAGCGRCSGLTFVRVELGKAWDIAGACDSCRLWARGHWLDWLDYWRRKDGKR